MMILKSTYLHIRQIIVIIHVLAAVNAELVKIIPVNEDNSKVKDSRHRELD